MMSKRRSNILIPVMASFFASLFTTARCHYDTVDLDQQQRVALSAVVQELIGFTEMPTPDVDPLGHSSIAFDSRSNYDDLREMTGTSRPRTSSVSDRVPHYMQRLYEQYQSGELFQEADTVRSIHAQQAIINNSTYTVFNLSSISNAESIIASQIHVYRKYLHVDPPSKEQRHHRDDRTKHHRLSETHHKQQQAVGFANVTSPSATYPEIEDVGVETTMNIYTLAPSSINKLATLSISKSERSGWQSFDATSIVDRQSIGGGYRMMAVRFEHQASSPGGTTDTDTTPLTLSDYRQRFTRLVLLVFTKQQQQPPPPPSDSVDLQRHHQLRYHSAADADSSLHGVRSRHLRTKHGQRASGASPTFHRSRWPNLTRDSGGVVGPDRQPTERNSDDNLPPSTKSGSQIAVSRNATTRRTHTPASDLEDGRRSVGFFGTSEVDSETSRLADPRFQPVEEVSISDSNIDGDDISRNKRSIDDNGIEETTSEWPKTDTDDVIVEEVGYNMPPRVTSRRVIQVNGGRHRSRQHHHHSINQTLQVSSKLMTTLPTTFTSSSPSAMPGEATKNSTGFQSTRTGNGRRRSRPRHSKKRPVAVVDDEDAEQSQLLPDPSEYVDAAGGITFWNDEIDDGQCKRRRLMVDFADIGWSDWIVSPSSFEAFYCDGECRFPIPKKLRPTNHASIQSIVRAVGIHSSVPSPCCVPSSLTPLTLLYIDENHNIIIRNFPDMSVNGCACR